MNFFSRILSIVLFITLSNPVWCQVNQLSSCKQQSFQKFLDFFNPLTGKDSLLVLQDIGYADYPEVLLDSTYNEFYSSTYNDSYEFLSFNAIPTPNNLPYTLIPYFRPYATFRIDRSNGYLVCICHRYTSTRTIADLMILEFDSFDKEGTPISKLLLPYMVNLSEDDIYMSFSTLLYVSYSRLYYKSSEYSNTHDYINERTIQYRIDNQGGLFFDGEKREQTSRMGFGKLGSAPPKFIFLE